MDKAGLFVSCVLGVGCGRIGFDPPGGPGGDATDGVTGDGPGLSCAGLEPTCGSAGTSPCCGSPLVPGGMFYRSYDVGIDSAFADMTNPATVGDVRIDMYEATVGRFRQFVNAGMGTQASPPPTGAGARTLDGMSDRAGWDPAWNGNLAADTTALVLAVKCNATYQSWTDTPGASEALPMNCLTWFDAFAFCAWDGGFLPTEAEWNYVTTGGSEQRAYPWSSPPSSVTIDCSYTNYFDGTAFCVNPPTGSVNRVGSESPAGDGRWGHADLAGNLWEWTLDWQSPYANPCNDCADLTAASNRVMRGGFFANVATSLRGAVRAGFVPANRSNGGGVRCARAP